MKKLIMFTLLLLVTTLSACESNVTSVTGYDLTDLDSCIDAMVNDVSSLSCPSPDRETYLVTYLQQFESSFDTTNSTFTDSDFEFNSDKTGDSIRLKYWFQYIGLPDTSTNNYTTFKEILQTMYTDLRAINEYPEYSITGEFFGMDDIYFIFQVNTDDTLVGEIQIHRSLDPFTSVITETEGFLDSYGVDTDLETQILDILSNDYAVYVVVDVEAQEYQYKVYRQSEELGTTLSEVQTLVETALNDESLTKVPWTID